MKIKIDFGREKVFPIEIKHHDAKILQGHACPKGWAISGGRNSSLLPSRRVSYCCRLVGVISCLTSQDFNAKL